MFESLFNSIFGGMTGKTSSDSPCAQQEAIRKQILMTELSEEVKKLMNHYGISKDSKGMSGTTTLSEISTVVDRT